MNFYYKNIINILIFLVTFITLMNFTDNLKAMIIAYIFSLLYGIVKNFHLIENFNSYMNEIPLENNVNIKLIKNDESVNKDKAKANNNVKAKAKANNNVKAKANNNVKAKAKAKETNKSKENLDNIITEELINQFINKLKNEDNLLIIKKKENLYNLKPIRNNLRKNKVKNMYNKSLKGDKTIFKPIIISRDKFIVHGHHRWYAKKSLIENNINGVVNNKLYDENIDVVVIDYNIDKIIVKLKDFRSVFDKKLNVSQNNLLNMKKAEELIKNLKNNIQQLENFYSDTNINLV